MSSHRYTILDADGYYVNGVRLLDPYPMGAWLGRPCSYIVYAGDNPAPNPPAHDEVYPGVIFLHVRPSEEMSSGDRMDLTTGEVTKAPPPEPVPEEPAPEEPTQ